MHLKDDVVDGSVLNGVWQAILYSFVLDRPLVIKFFCEPETILYKKVNKFVFKTVTFYLEDDNNEEVRFNGEKVTITLQMIKIWTNMFTYKYMSICVCLFLHEW